MITELVKIESDDPIALFPSADIHPLCLMQ